MKKFMKKIDPKPILNWFETNMGKVVKDQVLPIILFSVLNSFSHKI